ncbi:MAG: hypothetical protein WCI36_04815 [bacterium]
MANVRQDFMEFRALGVNCFDCGFSLTGRNHTVGAEICSKIEKEFKAGTLEIDICDDQIRFVFEGVSVGFSESPDRLLAIKKMLESGMHLRFQPYQKDSNQKGFALFMYN